MNDNKKKNITEVGVLFFVIVALILSHIDIMIKTKKLDIPTIANIINTRTMYVFAGVFGFLPILIIISSRINKTTYKTVPAVLINIGIIAIFISFFFFTLVSKEENKILEKQIRFLFSDLFNDMLPFISSDKLEIAKTYIKNTELPDMANEDSKVKKSNKSLQNGAYAKLGIAAGVGVVLSLIVAMAQYNEDSFKDKIKGWFHTFGEAFVLLFIVAITDLVFLYIIPVNYKSLDPNEIKYFIVDFLQKNTIDYKRNILPTITTPTINIPVIDTTSARDAEQAIKDAEQAAKDTTNQSTPPTEQATPSTEQATLPTNQSIPAAGQIST